MTRPIDPILLQRAAVGDRRAVDALVRALRPRIERQLQRYPVSDEDRRDLLQTTLMQVVRRLPSFRADAPFATWLFRVTANEALMMMRSHRRRRSRVVEGLETSQLDALSARCENALRPCPDASAAHGQLVAGTRSALLKLRREHRDVLIAHYHLDLELKEIAECLALSEVAVRSRLHRARAQLRALLEGTPIGTEACEGVAIRTRRRRRARASLPQTYIGHHVGAVLGSRSRASVTAVDRGCSSRGVSGKLQANEPHTAW